MHCKLSAMNVQSICPRNSEEWLKRVFECRAVDKGGVIKRQALDVEREVGHAVFVAAVRNRGCRLIRTRHHPVILCDQGPIEMQC